MKIRKIQRKKTRVAIILDNWFPVHGGEQVYVSKLAEFLVEDNDYEVDILTKNLKGSLGKEEKAIEKHEAIKVHRFPRFLYMVAAFSYLLFSWRKYSLYHAHSVRAAIIMRFVSWFTRVPTVVTVHNNYIFENAWTLRKLIHRVMFLETKYTQEITIAENFLKATNVNDPVLVIPNGVDPEPFNLIKVKKEEGQYTVLFVGSLVYSKGVDVLLKATKKLVESNDFIQSRKDFRLHLVGTGHEKKRLEKLAEELDIAKYVKFHGKVVGDNLIKLYKLADLFVLPSRTDSLPLTLLEACAARLPILATDVGDHRRLVFENSNGHLVLPDDVEELAYYLEYFSLNPGLEHMGEASYDLVTQEYNWDTATQKYLRIYDSIIHGEQKEVMTEVRADYMPWQVPLMLLKRRKLMRKYKGKKPVRFCMTINVAQAYTASKLPHELEHIPGFLERLSEFCASSEVPTTLMLQSDLWEHFVAELDGIQKAGHELGILALETDWQNLPDRKKAIRKYKDKLSELGFKKIHMLRAPGAVEDELLEYLHEHGLEFLPVSVDPMPHLVRKFVFVPYGEVFVMNLKNFLTWSDEEILASVERLAEYQRVNNIDPFVIFEAQSWEFQSRDHCDYAGGENFTELAKRLAFLKEHLDLQFMTLSEFLANLLI